VESTKSTAQTISPVLVGLSWFASFSESFHVSFKDTNLLFEKMLWFCVSDITTA